MDQEKTPFCPKLKNEGMVSFVDNDFVLNFLNDTDSKPMSMYPIPQTPFFFKKINKLILIFFLPISFAIKG